jgi:integrase
MTREASQADDRIGSSKYRPPLKTVRPKCALTITQAAQLLKALPPLAQTMVGLAMLSGLRRVEVFALRWKDLEGEGGA